MQSEISECLLAFRTVKRGSGWNHHLWDGTPLQDPHTSPAVMKSWVQKELSFITSPLAALYRLRLATCGPSLPVCTQIRGAVPSAATSLQDLHTPSMQRRNAGPSCTNQQWQCHVSWLAGHQNISRLVDCFTLVIKKAAMTPCPLSQQESRHWGVNVGKRWDRAIKSGYLSTYNFNSDHSDTNLSLVSPQTFRKHRAKLPEDPFKIPRCKAGQSL